MDKYFTPQTVVTFVNEHWILFSVLCTAVIAFALAYWAEGRRLRKPMNVTRLPNENEHRVWDIKFDKKDEPH